MRIMAIEDKENDILRIKDHAEEKEWELQIYSFDDCMKEVDSFDPDVIILDLRDDGIPDETAGVNIFSKIWKSRFRPTIIFSGFADSFNIDDLALGEYAEYAKSPLFETITKGDEQPVIDKLEYLADIVPSITRLRNKLNLALMTSASAIEIIKSVPNGEVQDYLLTSRILQYFQEPVLDLELPALVHYIYPPIGKQLFVGDILLNKSNQNSEDTSALFSIVLTPSCDLARLSEDALVLVAVAEEFSSIDSAFTNAYAKTDKKYIARNERIKKILNKGFENARVYLPALGDIIPHLCFNLKTLAMIPISDIGFDAQEGKAWLRIVSLASPYRERISWAYLNTACRPGVPTIDTEKWADDIFK